VSKGKIVARPPKSRAAAMTPSTDSTATGRTAAMTPSTDSTATGRTAAMTPSTNRTATGRTAASTDRTATGRYNYTSIYYHTFVDILLN
jgi:hypothetical protein